MKKLILMALVPIALACSSKKTENKAAEVQQQVEKKVDQNTKEAMLEKKTEELNKKVDSLEKKVDNLVNSL